MKKLLLLSLLVPMLTFADEPKEESKWSWTKQDYIVEAVALSLIVLDSSQTMHFVRHPELGIREANPFLPKHPSESTIRWVFIGSMVLHPLIAAALPKPWRTCWQTVTIVGNSMAITGNFVIGAGLSVPF